MGLDRCIPFFRRVMTKEGGWLALNSSELGHTYKKYDKKVGSWVGIDSGESRNVLKELIQNKISFLILLSSLL